MNTGAREIDRKYIQKQPYGDLTLLNRNGLILDSVGKDLLTKIVDDYLHLLETSAVVYEENGDYALGIFSSPWCRGLNQASRSLCKTGDNQKALASGQWYCHESCWNRASKLSIQTREAVDIRCHGGICLYVVPIRANGRVIGTISLGYGDPPKDARILDNLSKRFIVDPDTLKQWAGAYESKPEPIVELAKRHLSVSAHLIGEIVERKLTERALKASEEKFRSLFDNLPLNYIVLDDEGRIVEVNHAWIKCVGYRREEVIGKSMIDFFNKDSQKEFSQIFAQVKKKGIAEKFVFRLVNKSGMSIQVSCHASLNQDGKGHPTVHCILRDITDEIQMQKEKRLLERSLRHAQKMESIGNLAGGIAHDFNNLLFPIIVMSQLLLEDLPENSHEHENAREIYEAATQARGLVKQILTFSRQSDLVKVPMKIQHVLSEVVKLSKATIPSSIKIETHIQQDCRPVLAEPSRIHQVAMNLITNAYHALEGGKGRITLGFKEVYLKKAQGRKPALEPGPYVVLSVTDNGIGMEEKILDFIFEPYFTTKKNDKGTGLGLAVVHGIVMDHGGDVVVNSQLGKGTSVSVYLPSINTPISADRPAVSKSVARTGSERILLVDDIKQVVMLGKKVLERSGYQVFEEFSSRDALETFRRNPNAFDMVITDMTMPDMTGDELTQKIVQIRPDIPVIICTGYSESIDEKRALEIGAKGFLMKPLEKGPMIEMVRELLDQHQEA